MTERETQPYIYNDEYNNTAEVAASGNIVTPSTSQYSVNLEITPSEMLDSIQHIPTIKVEKLKRKISTVATVLNSPENIASKTKKMKEKALQEAKRAENKKLETKKEKKKNKTTSIIIFRRECIEGGEKRQ
ncbi:hypothetical protein JTB14_011561 [Gonioctena quinquepunctata]|nr:hypothetical protein JTB14_011561 [Gonioctena quinquepunctata]